MMPLIFVVGAGAYFMHRIFKSRNALKIEVKKVMDRRDSKGIITSRENEKVRGILNSEQRQYEWRVVMVYAGIAVILAVIDKVIL